MVGDKVYKTVRALGKWFKENAATLAKSSATCQQVRKVCAAHVLENLFHVDCVGHQC